MKNAMVEDANQHQHLQGLQDSLSQDSKQPRAYRVLGEPGVGKTRLVFEVLAHEALRQDVLYAKAPSVIETADIKRALYNAKGINLTLVVDECPYDRANELWEQFRDLEYPLNLITIYNETPESQFRDVEPFRIELHRFDNQAVAQILSSPPYSMPADLAAKVIRLCEGSPRAAHIFGRSYARNPQAFEEDALSGEAWKKLWRRYVAQENEIDSEICKKRELVLCFLALFKKFGAEGKYAEEKDAIYKLIDSITPGSVTRDEFHAIIKTFRSLKILQGDTTYYITPKALHVRYWDEFWARYRAGFDIDQHLEPLTSKMEEWWRRMFEYTNGSESAVQVVDWLLGGDGPFFKKKTSC